MCKRKIGYRKVSSGQRSLGGKRLYYLPGGLSVWLCWDDDCEEAFNDGAEPRVVVEEEEEVEHD